MMAMDKINGSQLPRTGYAEQARPGDRKVGGTSSETKGAQDVLGNGTGATPLPATGGDTAQISETAHRLMALRQAVQTGRAALEGLPDLRDDKVAQARERLLSGFYDTKEVRESTAAGLAGVFSAMDKL